MLNPITPKFGAGGHYWIQLLQSYQFGLDLGLQILASNVWFLKLADNSRTPTFEVYSSQKVPALAALSRVSLLANLFGSSSLIVRTMARKSINALGL